MVPSYLSLLGTVPVVCHSLCPAQTLHDTVLVGMVQTAPAGVLTDSGLITGHCLSMCPGHTWFAVSHAQWMILHSQTLSSMSSAKALASS